MTVGATRFAAIDFESAGAQRGATDVPVQIGLACLEPPFDLLGETFLSYLASDQPIVWNAQKVHGISDAHLRGAPALLALWPKIRSLLDDRWIVAHGAATEKRFLRAFPFHGFGPWVDTLKLSRALWPDLPSHSLGDLITSQGLEPALRESHPSFRWHDALSDAIASLILLRHIITTAGISDQDQSILLRADDSHYHRLKSRRHDRKSREGEPPGEP